MDSRLRRPEVLLSPSGEANALLFAANQGSEENFKMLLDAVCLTCPRVVVHEVVMCVIDKSHANKLRLILDYFPQAIHIHDSQGLTPLDKAIKNGNKIIVNILLERLGDSCIGVNPRTLLLPIEQAIRSQAWDVLPLLWPVTDVKALVERKEFRNYLDEATFSIRVTILAELIRYQLAHPDHDLGLMAKFGKLMQQGRSVIGVHLLRDYVNNYYLPRYLEERQSQPEYTGFFGRIRHHSKAAKLAAAQRLLERGAENLSAAEASDSALTSGRLGLAYSMVRRS